MECRERVIIRFAAKLHENNAQPCLRLHPRVDILIRQLSKNDTNIDDC